jgi:hypothetical protein
VAAARKVPSAEAATARQAVLGALLETQVIPESDDVYIGPKIWELPAAIKWLPSTDDAMS